MLRDYFCDKDANALLTPSGWQLQLHWPEGDDRYIDSRLGSGLAWWGDSIGLSTMITATRRTGRILEALFDTWTLHSWSQWIETCNETVSPVILHVDDHRDLGCPRLFCQSGAFYDAITGDRCDIGRAESVRASILSGAIGMGSFMTPFLHCFPDSEIRHLCQPPKALATTDFHFSTVTELDTLLGPGMARPSIEFSPLAGNENRSGPGRLRITPNLQDWLRGLGPLDTRPILLHIDMDYFNNRYDGDSDWDQRNIRLDPSCNDVLSRIDLFCEALVQADIGRRIEDIVIAYSPGFFPAELWAPASARLRSGLTRIVKE